MKTNLTLSKKNEAGDVPVFTFANAQMYLNAELANPAQLKFHEWIETIDLNNSVLACFQTFRVKDNHRNDVCAVLVSHDWDEITDFCESHLDFKNGNDVNFAIFEFDNYEEALNYCIDLREGF